MWKNSLADRSSSVSLRAEQLYRTELSYLYRWTDRLFVVLLLLEWVAGILVALLDSPRTWSGALNEVHPHVWAAIVLGGVFAAFPSYLAFVRPGTALTRYAIAVAQMLWSALLIHLTGGRIESHFHVFGSLAFLAFYRDWRVLATATLVVIADHLAGGIYWPQSVYGTAASGLWRSFEHGFWVVFEDTFLLISIHHSLRQSRKIATKQALLEQHHSGEIEAKNCDLEQANKLLESANRRLEVQVRERIDATRALSVSEDRYRRIVELSPFAILVIKESKIVFVNRPCVVLFDANDPVQLVGRSLADLFHQDNRSWIVDLCRADGQDYVALLREALSWAWMERRKRWKSAPFASWTTER